jgi:hypothetical protein
MKISQNAIKFFICSSQSSKDVIPWSETRSQYLQSRHKRWFGAVYRSQSVEQQSSGTWSEIQRSITHQWPVPGLCKSIIDLTSGCETKKCRKEVKILPSLGTDTKSVRVKFANGCSIKPIRHRGRDTSAAEKPREKGNVGIRQQFVEWRCKIRVWVVCLCSICRLRR